MNNINSPLINVYHSCLKRADNSRYRSLCPVCQHGTLLMVRDQVSMVLEEYISNKDDRHLPIVSKKIKDLL